MHIVVNDHSVFSMMNLISTNTYKLKFIYSYLHAMYKKSQNCQIMSIISQTTFYEQQAYLCNHCIVDIAFHL